MMARSLGRLATLRNHAARQPSRQGALLIEARVKLLYWAAMA